ncbi:MAG: hypothetical protein RPU41_10440, partial [Candidatus Sedimenticola sp. (ex Thyasira tokunagai)]
ELPLETFNLQQGGNNWQNQQKIVNNLTNQGGSLFGANPGSVFGAIQHRGVTPSLRSPWLAALAWIGVDNSNRENPLASNSPDCIVLVQT